MLGWYRMYRGWMDHPAFKNEPYTEREAWEWLISEARYESRTLCIIGQPVTLERGQISHSHRFLAQKWGWNPSKTLRFLKKLEKWSMIEAQSEAGQNIITICNYNKYQTTEKENEAVSKQQPEQQRSRSDAKKKESKESKESLSTDFENFWKIYPRRKEANPKKPAKEKFIRLIKSGVDPQELIAGAEIYAKACRAEGKENTSYVAQSITWLNQERWKDQQESITNGEQKWSGPF